MVLVSAIGMIATVMVKNGRRRNMPYGTESDYRDWELSQELKGRKVKRDTEVAHPPMAPEPRDEQFDDDEGRWPPTT